MASYTDAISQFNPYIQQLPVELMAKVGMQKQAQYDAGVQKIQSYIDNVAGLETSRPQDKEYLESKLNELGSKLRVVAAGDFSNQQLVSSVGGMASSIIKDPYIQSAVYSTAKIKKNTELMSEAQKKGELAPQNVFEYNKGLNQYMGGQLGDRFDGQYIPYRDVFKKLKEIGDSVGIDGSKIKQLFETDENGNQIPEYVTDKQGNKIFKGFKWNPIAVTEALKGKDAEKILSMFEAALDPADYQQLAMNGKWTFKDRTPEDLASMSERTYASQLKELDGAIEKQRLYLFTAENSGKPNQEDIKAHAGLYSSLSKQRDALANSAKTAARLAMEDPDQARASLYTNTYLSGVSLGMSSQDREIDSDVSPLFDVMDKNRNYDMQIAENRASNYWKKLNYLNDVRGLDIQEANARRAALEMRLKFGVDETGKPIGLPDELDLDKEGVSEQLVDQVEGSYTQLQDQTNGLAYKLTAKYLKSLPGNENLTDQQLGLKIASTLKHYKAPIIPGEENAILNKFAGKLVAKFNKNKDSVPPESQGLIGKYIKSIEETTYARADMENIEKESYRLAKAEGIDVAGIQDVKKSIKPLTLEIFPINNPGTIFAKAEKTKITLDKSDMDDLAKIHMVNSSVASSDADKAQANFAREKIKSKYGAQKASAIFDRVFSAGGGAISQVADISSKYGALQNAKLTKIKAQLYKDNGYVTQGTRVPLYTDESNKAVVGDKLSTILNKYKSVIPEEDVNELVKGVTDGKFKANVDTRGVGLSGATNNYLEINGKIIPISAQDYQFLANQAPPENRGVPPFVKYIDSHGTSNITGTPNPNIGNLFKDKDFNNFKSKDYTLTGDFVPSDDNPDLYFLKIYKHDKTGKKPPVTITYPYAIPKLDGTGAINSQLRSIASGINNNVLQQLENE
jgi:hypothetical protein